MSDLPMARFELRKVSKNEWLILDHVYDESDPHRTVGCIDELDTHEVDVMWIRKIPLAKRYLSPVDALDDVRRFYEISRATPPIPTPRRPPLLST